ncbi:uncharacterized protein V6R79_021578 [Siganus canaliculatus]
MLRLSQAVARNARFITPNFKQQMVSDENGSSSFAFPKGQQPLLPPQTTRHKSPKNNGNLQSAVKDIRRQRGKTSCNKELTNQKSFITVEETVVI